MTRTPILQFGTSRFLQAHADCFISEALSKGQARGPITVVHSSGDRSRISRLKALAEPHGFEVRIEGITKGNIIKESTQVNSVARAISATDDAEELRRIFVDEAEIVLSNTSDAGWVPQPADGDTQFSAEMSFPAKLTSLLFDRYQAIGRPIQIMPLELIASNGDRLREIVLKLANRRSDEFVQWVKANVSFINSLVDRIVSQPLDPAGAVCEPYALWAIQHHPKLVLPCIHPDVLVVPNLLPYEQLKLHILNLGHTYLVDRWIEQGKARGEYVRELLADPSIKADLNHLYGAEVIPTFDRADLGEDARNYAQTTIDRFSNPFLDHLLSDIAQNHAEKIRRRIGAFLDWGQRLGEVPHQPHLRHVVSRNL